MSLFRSLIKIILGKMKQARLIQCECACHAECDQEKPKRAYCKTLDQRLVDLAFDAFQYLLDTQRKTFKTKDIWENHHKLTDFQKLGYWDIFRKTRGEGWKITETGYRFLTGQLELPQRVWVRDWLKLGTPVKVSDDTVTIDDLKPRWQDSRSDFTLDYITRYRYKVAPKQQMALV